MILSATVFFSGSDSQIGTSLGSIPIPDVHGSGTVLDLQAHDAPETRKMRDDSKIHHIMADAMFRPRKQVGFKLNKLKSDEILICNTACGCCVIKSIRVNISLLFIDS